MTRPNGTGLRARGNRRRSTSPRERPHARENENKARKYYGGTNYSADCREHAPTRQEDPGALPEPGRNHWMHAVHGTRPRDSAFGMPFAIVTAALALGLASPLAGTAQPHPGQPGAAVDPAGADAAAAETDTEAPPDGTPPDEAPPDGTPPDQTPPDQPPTFLDSVTISATLRPAAVRDTPGVVSVIDGETIQERMVEDFADLVKYEPGVYVENNVTRLGLNGFNIRGIGGNRVMTLVDGVQTSEQFDFGPFNVHQAGLDVDLLKTVEIVRSANSALYGSDALGGVVSLFTKDPEDYLLDRRFYLGGKTTWDSRADAVGANVTLAAGGERVQASVFASLDRGGELGNQGVVDTRDHTRTAPNPQDVEGRQVLAKLVYSASPDNRWRAAAERYDSRVETDWLSNNRLLDFGRFAYSHRRVGRPRHAGAPAALARPHPRRPRDRPAVVADLRAAQRHRAGPGRGADDHRLRAAVLVGPPRHPRLRGRWATGGRPRASTGWAVRTTACSSRSEAATRPTTSTCSATGRRPTSPPDDRSRPT